MFRKLMGLLVPSRDSREGFQKVSAVDPIRKLGLLSRSLLIKASDGHQYVLKMTSGASCNEMSLHEAFGSELASLLGLPVPRWRAIHVSESFLQRTTDMWPTDDGASQPGYYFATELLGSRPDERLHDYLPSSWMNRVVNRDDFVGTLLLDTWLGAAANRQAVFVQDAKSASIRAVFIGHGKMISPLMRTLLYPTAGQYSNKRIYDDCWNPETFSYWKDKIISAPKSSLQALGLAIPTQWKYRRYHQLLDLLLTRRKEFKQLTFAHFDLAAKVYVTPQTTSCRDIAFRAGQSSALTSSVVISAGDEVAQPV
jgi:hypothetical protein